MDEQAWPALPLAEWEKTYATLHMWTQVVGKVTLALTPKVNHWWNVAFQITPRGFTTPTLHYQDKALRIDFDFIKHQLNITCDSGVTATMALAPMPVADFYRRCMSMLDELGINIRIWPVPVEVENPIPFDKDFQNNSYDPEFATRLCRILFQADRVLNEFRAGFIGKCSPVHFFWGSFDLAVTRFSGRRAPEREGADPITREAYSHEVISHGFWPGRRASGATTREESRLSVAEPAFYSYTVPEPPGLGAARIIPPDAFYHPELKEWILLYDDMRRAQSPEKALSSFLETTYQAGATLAGWNREELERK
jgi:hypothetical protein